MSVIKRLTDYLVYKGVTAYAFERSCELGNGYLGKQVKAKGSVGSDILEKIAIEYPDLDMNWLITGKGKMLRKKLPGTKNKVQEDGLLVREEAAVYTLKSQLIDQLKEQVKLLESSLSKRKKK